MGKSHSFLFHSACIWGLEVYPASFGDGKKAVREIFIIFIACIVIITRPKPAYGRQGLAGSWGQDTDEVSTFLVFLTSHFAPAALSSDLTNLGPLMTMKIHLETLKTIETNQKP